jgi:hypothetical protein
MIQFKLNKGGDHALKIINNEETFEWHNTQSSTEYLAWLEEGNTPLPPDPIPEPEPLTPQQKLEAAGLSIEELKELLGL